MEVIIDSTWFPLPKSVEAFRDILKEIEYKRTFKARIYSNGYLYEWGFYFTVSDMDTGEPLPLFFHVGEVPELWSMPVPEPVLVDLIWRAILQWEKHEAGEFFKYKGVKIHDPHAEERKITDGLRKDLTDSQNKDLTHSQNLPRS